MASPNALAYSRSFFSISAGDSFSRPGLSRKRVQNFRILYINFRQSKLKMNLIIRKLNPNRQTSLNHALLQCFGHMFERGPYYHSKSFQGAFYRIRDNVPSTAPPCEYSENCSRKFHLFCPWIQQSHFLKIS